MKRFGQSQRKVCKIVSLNRSSFHYKAKPSNDTEVRKRIKEIAAQKRRWGCELIHNKNHKKTERIYREENLMLHIRKRKKTASTVRIALEAPEKPNERWAMDFMSDCLYNGRKIRILGITDLFTRECLALEVDTSINGKRVANVLDRIVEYRGLPEVITVDNGPEFTGKVLDSWAYIREVQLDFIRPGKPVDNAFMESFNGRFREECLNDNWFMSLNHARALIEEWRKEYNTMRPHGSLHGLTPELFLLDFEEKTKLEVV